MKTIRASEISSFIYCRKAWYFQRQGVESENQAELASGTHLHARHGRKVMVNSCLQVMAALLFLVSLALLTMYMVGNFVG
jgi:CRISPR/Cas system-associated exonuclease Cas4 (RecB family)